MLGDNKLKFMITLVKLNVQKVWILSTRNWKN